jgi:hypothetical protein
MKEFYIARMKDGWSLSVIDDTDFFYYIELMAYMGKEDEQTMDEIF